MAHKLESICVYCGSRFGRQDIYREAAHTVGETIAKAGLRLVFGGGEQGLMGESARSARDAGGKVLGIIPKFLQDQEGLLDNIESREVETMHERKIGLFEESDAFCVLPGGIGTLEEVVEVLSWSSLSLHKKPIILANIDNYWKPLIELVDHICDEGFAYPGLRQSLVVIDDPAEIVEAAQKALVPDMTKI
ncbi:TIGR00730 family Rossman fold protein [Parvularcula sp. ZS-1/3]|uniref:Cytokinin riboside 5'-monophosphate phosphoribohydrolase n=1 Tax=Parvularcula mediterranea TaxID=2732508 RepID=A0A7Y3RNZ4_9PROT|nr:TIGR00730 family Rossman fold protein [Parvularcula mediterranea]NNU17100.1 TIGR00730 family Rossman fold protein [Parvularcula mediterranea]